VGCAFFYLFGLLAERHKAAFALPSLPLLLILLLFVDFIHFMSVYAFRRVCEERNEGNNYLFYYQAFPERALALFLGGQSIFPIKLL
jgi:hypothetical protein